MVTIPNSNTLPIYGCLTGITLPIEDFKLMAGINLQRGIFEIFSSPMLAFKEALPGSHTPGPWVPIAGGLSLKSKVELVITDLSATKNVSPSIATWLIAALLRLRVDAPVRVATIANMPLASLPESKNTWAFALEASPHQVGLFNNRQADLAMEDLEWLSNSLSIAMLLLSEERFMRSFSIFDECVWGNRLEISTTLIWTAIEILFGLSEEAQKTKKICSALSDHIAINSSDRDNAYNVIRQLYQKRGRIVHAGRKIEEHDFAQTFMIARVAFINVLAMGKLPEIKR